MFVPQVTLLHVVRMHVQRIFLLMFALEFRQIVIPAVVHVIGAQIIGGEEVTQRINALSFAIQKQMTVRELAKADTAYAPPLCETWEPMVLAAEMVLMKLR